MDEPSLALAQTAITPLLVAVLRILLSKPDGIHGYAVLQGLPDRPEGGRYQSGSVYPILRRLVDCGWATGEWQTGTAKPQRIVKLTTRVGRPAARAVVRSADTFSALPR